MHRIGRAGRYKDTGTSFVVYKTGIDNTINRLSKKNIVFRYYLLKDGKNMEPKPLKLRLKKKLYLDEQTNNQIKHIIYKSSKKVQPGYKKRLKYKIDRVKQKKRHEFIESRIKKVLVQKNIRDSKQRNKI
jgi:ATP-dependent RNA helicase CshB